MPSKGQAVECPKSNYTTPKGLEFSLYCNQDRTNIGDIDSDGADTIEECLNKCSAHPLQLCGTAAFDSNLFQCFFKTTNITAAGAVVRNGWILGVANPAQFQPLASTCTNNGKVQTAQNGLNFTIYCNQVVAGLDSCSDSSPGCRIHTRTLDECLEYCSTMSPLCSGVTWDAHLHLGYLNCYPKKGTAQAFDTTRRGLENFTSAKALLQFTADDCGAHINGTVTAVNKDIFTLACNEDRQGDNITTRHFDSLSRCIDACATFTSTPCVGAVFDANMVNGYENCHLKSTIEAPTPRQSGFTFAARQHTPSDNSTSSNPSQTPPKGHAANKGWIAAPVIGGILAIMILLVALRWRRRRKIHRNAQSVDFPSVGQQQEHWLKPELDHATAYAPKYEMDSSNRIYEMGSAVKTTNVQMVEGESR